jgi:hypothetical protein
MEFFELNEIDNNSSIIIMEVIIIIMIEDFNWIISIVNRIFQSLYLDIKDNF